MKLHIKTFSELANTELYEILRARAEVFMIELGMHCRDLDGVDYHALHCFFEKDGKVLAYLRAFGDEENPRVAYIGRVLTTVRGAGLGKRLMQDCVTAVKERLHRDRIVVHAQLQAAGFYEKLGFRVISDTYMEAGVLHVTMQL